jgi:hypothetical protein
MAKTIRERSGSPFYPPKDTFDAVLIPIRFVSESVAVVSEDASEIRRVIDEKPHFSRVTRVVKLLEKPPRRHIGSRWMEAERNDLVRFRIDSAAQPELFAVQADHRLVDRELIRRQRRNGL